MSKKRQYPQEAIENALKFVKENNVSIRQAALKFCVPRSSIQYKLQNPDTKFKSGPDPTLTAAEEDELCKFLINMSKRGFPLKKEDLQLCVQDFLQENPRPNRFRDGKPGDKWFKAFLNRHSNISIRTSEGVTNASACVSEADIRKWFYEIRQYIDEEGLSDTIQDPTRVFNADETGFNICPQTGKVLAEKGCKNVYQIEKASAKENITVLFTFSAAGQVCKPMIIYPYKRIPDRVTLSVPPGWGIGRSDSGWMTAAVFYDYIANCFYKELLDCNITFPVILFVDGHKTHITIEVSELCRSRKIHLIALYPNATRILQPADVTAFRPIKVGWRKSLRDWYASNNYQASMTKETFAPLLKTVVESSVKKETLINGFRITGLYPFEPNNVDYSKCIPSAKRAEDASASQIIAEKNESVLTYSDFRNIVGESILTKCYKPMVPVTQEADENFIAIYKLWQKFNGQLQNDNNNKDTEPDLNTEICTKESQLMIEASRDDELYSIEENKEPHILDERSGKLIGKDKRKNDHNEETKKREEDVEVKNHQISNNSIDTYSPQPCKLKVTELQKPNKPRDTQSPQPSTSKQTELIMPNNPRDTSSPQPSTSKTIDPNKKISIISNVPLSEYLHKKLPDSPKRQGKRKIERLPFALTSDQYVEQIRAKQKKKEDEENAKEERKRLREEKKIQKENNAPKKKQNESGKGKTKRSETQENSEIHAGHKTKYKYLVCCDLCLSPITRRIMTCNQCKKKFHLYCIPSSHRIHVPEDDDDSFLCHFCYKESNTDSSDGDTEDLFGAWIEAKKQGF